MELTEVLKALADPNRLRILCFLHGGEKCVCQIEKILPVAQPATSKHLHRLKKVGLIDGRKKAQWVHYHIPEKVYGEYPFLSELIRTAEKEQAFDYDVVSLMDCGEGTCGADPDGKKAD